MPNLQLNMEDVFMHGKSDAVSFIDIEFPPVNSSINKSIVLKSDHFNKIDPNAESTTGYDRVVHWRRPIEFISEMDGDARPTLFPSLPMTSKDIVRGHLRNEWFLSAVAALLEKDQNLIKRLFENREYCKEGVYRLRLYKQSKMQIVTVDDYIPCIPNGGSFFSCTLANENSNSSKDSSYSIWMQILEKAYAKLHGGYKYLEGGSAVEALRELTGCPVTRFEFQ